MPTTRIPMDFLDKENAQKTWGSTIVYQRNADDCTGTEKLAQQ